MARILVVDDEETLCEVLRFNLEEEGYDVDTAYSAEEALALELSDYSLILLDIMMDGITSRFGCESKISLKKSPPLWVDSWVCQIKRLISRSRTGCNEY